MVHAAHDAPANRGPAMQDGQPDDAYLIRLLSVLPGYGGRLPSPGRLPADLRRYLRDAGRAELEAVLIATMQSLAARQE